jgi:hypothetical protein
VVNYYDILGIRPSATDAEIKAAFRQLAKIYHPDINPQGREKFVQILKAYETLIDPNKKYVHDHKLSAATNSSSSKKSSSQATREKNWNYDERELKRRQYYNEHIKKYEKKTARETRVNTPPSNYKEWKYILFAAPLAIALFIGIMHVAGKKSKTDTATQTGSKVTSDLKMGDAPYTSYFGEQRYLPGDSGVLVVKNLCGTDAVICLFQGTQFVRSCYLEAGFSAEIPQLPTLDLMLRYSTGKYFRQTQHLTGTSASGAFSEDLVFYTCNRAFPLNSINQLTLLPGTNEGFESVSAAEFFKKSS